MPPEQENSETPPEAAVETISLGIEEAPTSISDLSKIQAQRKKNSYVELLKIFRLQNQAFREASVAFLEGLRKADVSDFYIPADEKIARKTVEDLVQRFSLETPVKQVWTHTPVVYKSRETQQQYTVTSNSAEYQGNPAVFSAEHAYELVQLIKLNKKFAQPNHAVIPAGISADKRLLIERAIEEENRLRPAEFRINIKNPVDKATVSAEILAQVDQKWTDFANKQQAAQAPVAAAADAAANDDDEATAFLQDAINRLKGDDETPEVPEPSAPEVQKATLSVIFKHKSTGWTLVHHRNGEIDLIDPAGQKFSAIKTEEGTFTTQDGQVTGFYDKPQAEADDKPIAETSEALSGDLPPPPKGSPTVLDVLHHETAGWQMRFWSDDVITLVDPNGKQFEAALTQDGRWVTTGKDFITGEDVISQDSGFTTDPADFTPEADISSEPVGAITYSLNDGIIRENGVPYDDVTAIGTVWTAGATPIAAELAYDGESPPEGAQTWIHEMGVEAVRRALETQDAPVAQNASDSTQELAFVNHVAAEFKGIAAGTANHGAIDACIAELNAAHRPGDLSHVCPGETDRILPILFAIPVEEKIEYQDPRSPNLLQEALRAIPVDETTDDVVEIDPASTAEFYAPPQKEPRAEDNGSAEATQLDFDARLAALGAQAREIFASLARPEPTPPSVTPDEPETGDEKVPQATPVRAPAFIPA